MNNFLRHTLQFPRHTLQSSFLKMLKIKDFLKKAHVIRCRDLRHTLQDLRHTLQRLIEKTLNSIMFLDSKKVGRCIMRVILMRIMREKDRLRPPSLWVTGASL